MAADGVELVDLDLAISRSTLKRHAYIAHTEQPVGMVVQAAAAPAGGFDAIVSLQIASTEEALHVGTADGVALALQPLPYALLEDI